jgi:hypothetical protein
VKDLSKYDLNAYMADLTESRRGQTLPVPFDPVAETLAIWRCRYEAMKRGLRGSADFKGLARETARRRRLPGATN